MAKDPSTLVITNWNGALTRQNFGDINSGLANFDTSFGYNPFFNPGQLTWFKSPAIVSGLTGLVVARCSRVESGVVATYVVTNDGHFAKILGEGASVVDYGAFGNKGQGTPTFTYGGDMTFYGATDTIYIGHDQGVTKILLTGITTTSGAQTEVGTWDATHFTAITSRRGLVQAFGLLYVINSDASVTYANNVAEISNAGVVNNYAKFAQGFGAGAYIRDLDVRPDLTYLLISVSLIPSELLAPVNDLGNGASSETTLYAWNGSTAGSLVADAAYTTGISLPNFGVTALQSFSGRQLMFMYDTFGTAVYEEGEKKLTMRNSKSPMPGATASAGNFITWMNPEFQWNLDTGVGSIYGSLFYYGRLDENSPVGLWRVLRYSSAIGGTIYTVPVCAYTTNRYVSVDTSDTIVVKFNGTHLYSFIDYSGSGGSTNNRLYTFYVAPPDDSPGGWTGAIAGVYQTQTQMFSKKYKATQIRVYTDPTVSNNEFNLDLIGPDGKKITNGSFNYAYAAGTDQTLLQGAQDRINFQAATAPFYGLGVRIQNVGSANWTLNKVEIDIEPMGK